MMLDRIRNPILFHGDLKANEYFEGWYYKQVSKDERTVISLIPGVSLTRGDTHCFVQYNYVHLNDTGMKTLKTGYLRYPIKEFTVEGDPFTLRIENNIFTESSVTVDLDDHGFHIAGTLELGLFLPIRKSVLMPDIMGFFAYVPKMECYHGVISMDHKLRGTLGINGEEVDFQDGKGYIEKDWGTSFPRKYVWIQCNHFNNKSTSLILSAADIPFLNSSFQGFFCNLTTDGSEYRFATYNRSRIKFERVDNDRVSLLIESRRTKLRITATPDHMGALVAPQNGRMQKAVKEGLSGEIEIILYNKHDDEIIYEDAGVMAGIEISGF